MKSCVARGKKNWENLKLSVTLAAKSSLLYFINWKGFTLRKLKGNLVKIQSCPATVSNIPNVFIKMCSLLKSGRVIKTVTSQETCLSGIDSAFVD